MLAGVAAAAVDVDDPVPMPDGQSLVHPPGKEAGGGVAHDGGAVGEWGDAVGHRPVPDPPVRVLRRHAVDQVEGLGDYLELEIIGQGEKQRPACLKEIEAAMKEMGYEQKDTIRISYLSMLQKKESSKKTGHIFENSQKEQSGEIL